MKLLNSNYRPLCPVELPAYAGRQHYMHTFDLKNPLMAAGFDEFHETVLELCRAAGANEGLAHMTVDEKVIEPGMSQRRPRPHVDGCYYPKLQSWGGGGGGWLHYCNNISGESALRRMPIIVAASVAGCRAWRGMFEAVPKEDGDLTHAMQMLGEGEVLPANTGYLLSADCVHESMVFAVRTVRTFLRIALPVDFDGFASAPARTPNAPVSEPGANKKD